MKGIKHILSCVLVAVSLSSASVWAEMVNINKASAAAIQQNLKGVGEKKAEAIVAYRTEHGDFKSLEDIKQVKGIGDGIFEKIKADISLDQGIIEVTAGAGKNTGKATGAEAPAEAKADPQEGKAAAKPEQKVEATPASTTKTGKAEKS